MKALFSNVNTRCEDSRCAASFSFSLATVQTAMRAQWLDTPGSKEVVMKKSIGTMMIHSNTPCTM